MTEHTCAKRMYLTSDEFTLLNILRHSPSKHGRCFRTSHVVWNKHKLQCVLKEYTAHDPRSVVRMRRELDAYRRSAMLPPDERKRVARLLAFGALDLDLDDPTTNARLFTLVEYVPDDENEPVHVENELARIENALTVVGVRWNHGNYKVQRDDSGVFVKILDFDHATLVDLPVDTIKL